MKIMREGEADRHKRERERGGREGGRESVTAHGLQRLVAPLGCKWAEEEESERKRETAGE